MPERKRNGKARLSTLRDEAALFHLSSKSHWGRFPFQIGERQVHVLRRPTRHPPDLRRFPKTAMGRRNFDEIPPVGPILLAGGERADYIRDDAGRFGGLAQGRPDFVRHGRI